MYQLLANVPTPVELVIMELSDLVNIRFISQLISGISRDLHKLLNISGAQLFQHHLYYQRQGFFQLFLPWILIIQNLLFHHLDVCGNAINFLMSSRDYYCPHNIHVFCIFSLGITYLADAVYKWCTIFECHLLISFAYISYCSIRMDVEIVVTLKYLCNFWRTFEIPLINCKINLMLTRSTKLRYYQFSRCRNIRNNWYKTVRCSI